MNTADIIVIAVLAAVIISAIVVIIRNKKKGRSSCGGCTGDCSSCANAVKNVSDKEKKQ